MAADTPREDIWVVLPSLNPSESFDRVVDGVLSAGFSHLLIVDDGSRPENKAHFRRAEAFPQCTVLTHEVNRGKGAALKTAFSYLADRCPDARGAVTIDGDGQHLTADILRCAAAIDGPDTLVMGCRDFSAPDIPPRSRIGNRVTSTVFRVLCGIRLSDTQTGLRAIPARYLETFCGVEGERFEYETNMLLYMKRLGIPFLEQPIATVYDPEDYSSHYNPVKDSLRISRVMLRFLTTGSGFRYVVSAVCSWLVDNGLYLLLMTLLGGRLAAAAASPVSQVSARALSSLFNFTMNDRYVFRNGENHWKAFLKYYCLCIPQTLISVVCLTALVAGLKIGHPVLATLVKIVIELILFVISYYIQKKWVFSDKTR